MRDEKLDFLRFVGIALIILAHCQPSPFLFQLCNFDVPLMLLVAGAAFGRSYRHESYKEYIFKRFKRLVFPCWIFLNFYFIGLGVTSAFTHIELPTIKTVAGSYLLLSGIGYVWIIRVFLLVALVAPFIYQVHLSNRNHPKFFLILGAVYLDYEIALYLLRPLLEGVGGRLFENTVLYLIPYAVVFAIGLRLPRLPRASILMLSFISFTIFSMCMLVFMLQSGSIIGTQAFKYPPQIYYLSYALCAACLVWAFAAKAVAFCHKHDLMRPVLFVAQNSIWIYLWHIPFIEFLTLPSYIKFPLTFALAANITFLQGILVRQFLLPRIADADKRKDMQMVLIG